MGEMDKALADFDQSIKLDPKNALPYYNRGLAFRDKGDHDRAIADFSHSDGTRANALAFYNRGLAYWDRRDFDKALADYEQAIRINPGYAPTYYNRGLAYFERRDYDRAIQDLNQAINGRPNYPLAFNIRGLAYLAKGETDRGIQDFDQAIRLDAKLPSPTTIAAKPIRASAISTAPSPISTRPSRPIRTTMHEPTTTGAWRCARQARFRARSGGFLGGDQDQSGERGILQQPGLRLLEPGQQRQCHRRLRAGDQARPEVRAAYANRGHHLLSQARLHPRHRRFRPGHQAQSEQPDGLP